MRDESIKIVPACKEQGGPWPKTGRAHSFCRIGDFQVAFHEDLEDNTAQFSAPIDTRPRVELGASFLRGAAPHAFDCATSREDQKQAVTALTLVEPTKRLALIR